MIRAQAALLFCAGTLLSAAADIGHLDAQERGVVEIGTLGRVTRLDDDIRLDPAFGAGGVLAMLIAHNLAIELSASYAQSDSRLPPGSLSGSYLPLAMRLVRRDSLTPRAGLLYGAGVVRNHYGLDYDTYEYGGSVLVGMRWRLGRLASLRSEGVMDVMTSPSSGSIADWTFALQVGATIQLNRLPPPDDDFDGVPDASDDCPLTRRGTAVDDRGCPLPPDEDVDGVPDPRDQCPGTPISAVVDARGCPRFPDSSAVTPPPPPDALPSGVADHTGRVARWDGHSYIRAFRWYESPRRARLRPFASPSGRRLDSGRQPPPRFPASGLPSPPSPA